MSERKIRVGIIFGGRSGEHEVSLMSANGVIGALDRDKYEVIPIAITRSGKWLPPGPAVAMLTGRGEGQPADGGRGDLAAATDAALVADPRARAMVTFDGSGQVAPAVLQRFDVVFPVLHGPYGEDGTVQGFLELANIPYVGAGVLGSALGLDKSKMKEVLRYHGLRVPDWRVFRRWQWREDQAGVLQGAASFGFPCFAKPANLGSSVGVSKVHEAGELPAALEEAFRHDEKVLVEQAVDGREIEVAVLGNHRPETSVPGEVVPSGEFYDYRAKYVDGGTALHIPADVTPAQAGELRDLARRTFLALECAGLARVDFFLERGTGAIYVNEINTLPGFTPVSMYPKLWAASGLSYSALVDRLLQLAIERWQERNAGGGGAGE